MNAINFERINFLIVDDNKYMRVLLKNVLHAFGVKQIAEADDGADAFTQMKTFPPDVILLDQFMSPLDGIEFTRLVRTARDSPNIYVPIIMITGHTDTGTVVNARDSGITEFLAKPVTPRALYSRLQSALFHDRPFVKTTSYFGPDRRRHDGKPYNGKNRRRERAGAV